MRGKCPTCSNIVNRCELEKIVIGNQAFGPFFHGVSMFCPYCQTVLGVSVDPASLAADVAGRVERKIQGKTR